jgi:hypothetical protein
VLVAAKHAKACFLSLRDRPTCVQNACAFSQPLGHLTVNCCRFPSCKVDRSTTCSLLRDRPTCVQNACAFSQPLGHHRKLLPYLLFSAAQMSRSACFLTSKRLLLAFFEGSQLYTTKPAKAMHMHFSGDIINPVLD